MDEDPPRKGSIAPDFSLPDQNGEKHALLDCRGHWVFLYFYQSDSISGCLKESSSLRKHFPEFQNLDIMIFGISPDSIENHKQFAEKHKLLFPLLSDPNEKVANQYGTLTKEHISGNRSDVAQMSFLINLAGEVEKVYQHIKPEMVASHVLADFAKITKQDQDESSL